MTTVAAPPVPVPATRSDRVGGAVRRASGRAASVAAAVTLAVLALIVLGLLTGHRVLVDRGDSMRPALSAGDLLINRTAPAERVAVGDIVTFDAPGRDRRVTHRVVARSLAGGRVDFETRGDANSGGERWSVARNKDVGLLLASVPRAGYGFGLLVSPPVRLVLTIVCVGAFGLVALRWIWRSDRAAEGLEQSPRAADNEQGGGSRPAVPK